MVPPDGKPARFGMNVAGVLISMDPELQSDGEYKLAVASRNTSQGLAVFGANLNFWGHPADPRHDFQRWCPKSADFGSLGRGQAALAHADLLPAGGPGAALEGQGRLMG